MKTPEEIKRAMKGCAKDDCRECAYYKNRATCMEEMMVDALAYIRQLEALRMRATVRNKQKRMIERLEKAEQKE